jgi:trk system potassium uptake protein TrkA
MRTIVIGYGRVGIQLVRKLLEEDHQVTVVDKNRAALERDARHLRARIVVGDATDPVLLKEAGADKADVVYVLTRNENSNLMAAQIAKSVYKVPRVVAVVYDPEREQGFHGAGIETFPISLAGAELLAMKLRAGAPARLSDAFDDVEKLLEARPKTQPAPMREGQPGQPSYIIIVGGGKVGYYLGRMLLQKGHEISVIENNPEIFALVSNQLDCPVIWGDGSTTSVLQRAGANRCNVFVAVTNNDDNNLIACQVAKFHFGIPRTIARVKNPKNEAVLQMLGVDVTVSSTALISQIIESELPARGLRTLLSLNVGNLEILEFTLDAASPVVGRALKDLSFPPNASVVAILRDGRPVVPKGDTVFENQDIVLAMAQSAGEEDLRRLLVGS